MATNASVKDQLGPVPAEDHPRPAPGQELERAADMGHGVMRDVTVATRINYAEKLAYSGLLPESFRGKPANVFYAIEYGNMLGIHPLAAITGVHVMDGKPTASSSLMGALVRRAGHRLRVTAKGSLRTGDLTATAEIIRSDDPEFTYRATWDLDRAQRAGLIQRLDIDQQGRTVITAKTPKGKPSSWEKFPEAMLKARAISEVSREACEEALAGVHYTPEELGAVVDEDENVIEGTLVEASAAPAAPAVAVDWAGLAEAADGIDGVREVWSRAAQAGALDEALRRQLNRIAANKRAAEDAAEQQQPTEQSPVDVTDAEVVENPPDGYDDAGWLAGEPAAVS
jgi:hypothetical protein